MSNSEEEQIKCTSDETEQWIEDDFVVLHMEEVDNLVVGKGLAEMEEEILEGGVPTLHKEVDSLHYEENELELQHEKENQGSATYDNLGNLYFEKEHLAVQVNELHLEVNSLLVQKAELKEQIRINSYEAKELREENQALLFLRTKRENELSDQKLLNEQGVSLKNYQVVQTQKENAKAQLSHLQLEVDSLHVKTRKKEENEDEISALLNELVVEKDETIKMLQRIQQENQGEIARLQVEFKKLGESEDVDAEKPLKSLHELEIVTVERNKTLKKKQHEMLEMTKKREEIIRQFFIRIGTHLERIDDLKK